MRENCSVFWDNTFWNCGSITSCILIEFHLKFSHNSRRNSLSTTDGILLEFPWSFRRIETDFTQNSKQTSFGIQKRLLSKFLQKFYQNSRQILRLNSRRVPNITHGEIQTECSQNSNLKSLREFRLKLCLKNLKNSEKQNFWYITKELFSVALYFKRRYKGRQKGR